MFIKNQYRVIVGVFIIGLIGAGVFFMASRVRSNTGNVPEDRSVSIPGQGKAQYFGNDVTADMNGDNMPDSAYLVVLDSSGTGRFYYLVADLSGAGGRVRTQPMFVGDRIAPQTTEWRDNAIIVNYADRKQGEPMTTTPSLAVSKYFLIQNNQLVAK